MLDIQHKQHQISQSLKNRLMMTIPCTWKNPSIGAISEVYFYEGTTDIESIVIYDVVLQEDVETTDPFTEFSVDAFNAYFALKPKEFHKLLKVIFELKDYDPYADGVYEERQGKLLSKEEYLIQLHRSGFLEVYAETEPFSIGIFDFYNGRDKGAYVSKYDPQNFEFMITTRDRLKKQKPEADYHIDFV